MKISYRGWAVAVAAAAGTAFLAAAAPAQTGVSLPLGDPKRGRQVFVALKCQTCHAVHGETGVTITEPFSASPGPVLRDPSRKIGSDQIATSIVAPSHDITGFKTPTHLTASPMGDFAASLSVQDLSDLVAWLHRKDDGPQK